MYFSETTLSEITTRLHRVLDGCGSLPVAREDLIGEVVLRLLTMDESREVRNPYAYARTILQNLIRDHLRRSERAQRVMEAVSAAAPSSVPGLRAADELADGELVSLLFERTELSPLQSKVVHMIYFDDMTLTEVARELCKNPGTILRHLRRALEKLENSAAELELHR